MTARLPTPGADNGNWGTILNDFLEVSLKPDGTLNNNVVDTNQIQNNAVTNAQLDAPTQANLNKASTSLQNLQLGTANGVAPLDGTSAVPDANLPSRLSSATLSSTFASVTSVTSLQTHVTVGATGEYATLTAALAAFPSGGVDIEIMGGTHLLPTVLNPSAVPNVTIRGQGRDATIIECTGGFINATNNSDQWTIRDLSYFHVAGTNMDHGICVDYPRRWAIKSTRSQGFGGDTIRYQGGIHSEVDFNIISAKDSTSTNGHAGIYITESSLGVVPTTIHTTSNYVTGGIQYGIRAENVSSGLFIGDICESSAVGMSYFQCDGELAVPYTEDITGNAIEFIDSLLTCVGRFRSEPVVSWANTAASARFIARVGRNWINPGLGIIFVPEGGGTAPDPTISPSIQIGTGSPQGVVTAVTGSLWLRTDGTVDNTLYLKETGTGNTGWTTIGGTATPGTPTVVAGASAGTSPPAPVMTTGSTDLAGEVSMGSGTATATGVQAIVTFSAPYAATPNIVLVPSNITTATREVYVTAISATGFSVGFGAAPTASQPLNTYRTQYIVSTY